MSTSICKQLIANGGKRDMHNVDIRQYALEKRVNLWEVSEKLGYSHESSFSRLLRHELENEKKTGNTRNN